MLELTLKESIMKFVTVFRVVRVRQLKRFFANWGKAECDATIKMLTVDMKLLHAQRENDDIVSIVYPSNRPSPLYTYDGTLKCLDMMSGILKSDEIQWFDAADYPLNIMFLTTANELYDISYVDSSNLVQKAALFPIAWKRGLPPGEADPFNHIAVVPSLDVAQQLRYLPFDQFAVVDGNGGVVGIYDNDK